MVCFLEIAIIKAFNVADLQFYLVDYLPYLNIPIECKQQSTIRLTCGRLLFFVGNISATYK